MNTRRKRNVDLPRELTPRRTTARPRPGATRVLTVTLPLPLSVSRKVRRVVYPYPIPAQRRLKGRTLRSDLTTRRERYVDTPVRILMPNRLPLALGSYVSLSRNSLNIHSRNQLRRSLEKKREYNRKRRYEKKGHHRKARNGQLDSKGSTSFGSVAHAYRRGDSIDRIADAALGARAIFYGGM